jgi:hypothetical protein
MVPVWSALLAGQTGTKRLVARQIIGLVLVKAAAAGADAR